MAEMNAGQHNLAMAVVYQAVDFIDDGFERTTFHRGPNLGDDAVGASQQTTILHFDVGSVSIAESRDPIGKVDHAEATEQVGQLAFVGDDLRDVR